MRHAWRQVEPVLAPAINEFDAYTEALVKQTSSWTPVDENVK
jgi:hypothetical protein